MVEHRITSYNVCYTKLLRCDEGDGRHFQVLHRIREAPDHLERVITSYSIHYTKLYDQAPEVDGLTVVMGRGLVAGQLVRCGIRRVNGLDLEAVPVRGALDA